MGLPLRDEQHHTYGEYLTWPDDARYELIYGHAIMTAPATNLDHQDVAGELFRQISNQLVGKPCRPYIAPVDVRLPRSDEADENIDTVVQPDVIIVCDPGKLDRRGVRSAPDWVAEVLSPSTAVHDQVVKRRIYERAGVPEYWLVHPNDRTLTIYTLQNGAYGRPDIFELKGSTQFQTMPELEIAWDALIERLSEQEF